MKRHTLGGQLRRGVLVGLLLAVTAGVSFGAESGFENVIFLHHSTGAGLISGGNVRPLLTNLGYDFWDHGYNGDGLTMPDGNLDTYTYDIPGDNTDPDGLAAIFAQEYRADPATGAPYNAFSGLLRHDVIVFKSCFPASAITDDAMLDQYKAWYIGIRDRAEQFPDKLFIAFSTPPLTPGATTPGQAGRARLFSRWLKSQEFLAGHPNFLTFDFFGLLAEPDGSRPDRNMLRDRYRPADPSDSHPNGAANLRIGPVFARFVDNAARAYGQGCSAPPDAPLPASPPSGASFSARKILLTWGVVECAAYYQVEVRRDAVTGPTVVAEIAAQGRLRTLALAAGHSYRWRVAACNNLGCSAWSPFRKFRVLP